jgi:hypothetical protein
MTIRDEADDLLDDADLFSDPSRPVATVAELAEAYELPVHAVRACAAEMVIGAKVGHVTVFTRETALDLAEELDSQGWELGPADEEDEAAEDEADEGEEDDE